MGNSLKTPARASRPALVIVLLVFVPLAFSEELLQVALEVLGEEHWRGSWALLLIDGILLFIMLILSMFMWDRTQLRKMRLFAWWLGGASLTVVLDWITERYRDSNIFWLDASTAALYILALAVILAAVTGAAPWVVAKDPGNTVLKERARQDFKSALPLLAGILGAYAGSLMYDYFLTGRRRCDLFDAIAGNCVGAVDQQYFAQLSQVIPLLLVAVGLEARYFATRMTEPLQRGVAILTVLILCVGEVVAISALVKQNKGDAHDMLSPWHEYIAFILTLDACFVALAMLALVLISRTRDESRPYPDFAEVDMSRH